MSAESEASNAAAVAGGGEVAGESGGGGGAPAASKGGEGIDAIQGKLSSMQIGGEVGAASAAAAAAAAAAANGQQQKNDYFGFSSSQQSGGIALDVDGGGIAVNKQSSDVDVASTAGRAGGRAGEGGGGASRSSSSSSSSVSRRYGVPMANTNTSRNGGSAAGGANRGGGAQGLGGSGGAFNDDRRRGGGGGSGVRRAGGGGGGGGGGAGVGLGGGQQGGRTPRVGYETAGASPSMGPVDHPQLQLQVCALLAQEQCTKSSIVSLSIGDLIAMLLPLPLPLPCIGTRHVHPSGQLFPCCVYVVVVENDSTFLGYPALIPAGARMTMNRTCRRRAENGAECGICLRGSTCEVDPHDPALTPLDQPAPSGPRFPSMLILIPARCPQALRHLGYNGSNSGAPSPNSAGIEQQQQVQPGIGVGMYGAGGNGSAVHPDGGMGQGQPAVGLGVHHHHVSKVRLALDHITSSSSRRFHVSHSLPLSLSRRLLRRARVLAVFSFDEIGCVGEG